MTILWGIYTLESMLGIDLTYYKKQKLNAMDARLSWIKLMDLVILT